MITPGLPDVPGLGEEPLLFFTRAYIIFIQGLFAQFTPGSYKWSSDESVSEITISDQASFPRDRIGQRPAIVTVRGPCQFANMSLDNLRDLNWQTGEKTRTDIIACTMSLNCMAKEGVEAQRLAWILMRHFRALKGILQRNGGFFKIGDDLSMSPESPPGALVSPEADSEIVLVTVSSPFYFQWTDKTGYLDAPLARGIEFHMQTNLPSPESMTTKAMEKEAPLFKPPTINGMPVGIPTPDSVGFVQTVKI